MLGSHVRNLFHLWYSQDENQLLSVNNVIIVPLSDLCFFIIHTNTKNRFDLINVLNVYQ